jgi:hypothetical protein
MITSRPRTQFNPVVTSTHPRQAQLPSRQLNVSTELVTSAALLQPTEIAAKIRLKAKLKEYYRQMRDELRNSDGIEQKNLAIVSYIVNILAIITTIEGISANLRAQFIGLWVYKLRSMIERLPEYKDGSLTYTVYEILFKKLQNFSLVNNLDLYITKDFKTLSYVRAAALGLFCKNMVNSKRNATLQRQFFIDGAQKPLFATHLGEGLKFFQRIFSTHSVSKIRKWEELEFPPARVSSGYSSRGIDPDARFHYLSTRF